MEELELSEYHPRPMDDFDSFDEMIESCYIDKNNIANLVPSTLEGCVVRISDIIAYIGKDRQDAERAKLIFNDAFDDGTIGTYNAERLIISSLISSRTASENLIFRWMMSISQHLRRLSPITGS